jgi:hypothetical protein
MRLVFAASILAAAVAVPPPTFASPITDTSALGWGDGESRLFALERFDDESYRLTVDGFASASYASPWDCCAGFFDPVRDARPYSTLTFSQLQVNTLPVNTTFTDNLDLDLLRQAGIGTLLSLTGRITLNWNEPDIPLLAFSMFSDEPSIMADVQAPAQVPEPALLVLFGAGAMVATYRIRKRLQRARG